MKSGEDTAPRQKYPGYNALLLTWHESISADFDPLATLKDLAGNQGLVLTDKTTRTSRQLRIDTVESSQRGRRRRTVIDKSVRQEAAKLLRRALKDPAAAERIKRMVERARQGEDVGADMPDALDPDSESTGSSAISYRRI